MLLKTPSDREMELMCNADLLALDLETKDPLLTKKGPGTHRGDGYICGMSAGINNEVAFYFPIKHPDCKPEEIERNTKLISALVASKTPKIGVNIIYDFEWLEHEKFEVYKEEIHDVQYAEPILDEYKRSYSLENLAHKYSTQLKQTEVLREYHDTMGWTGKPIENIWRMPSEVAGEYAIADATLPIEIFKKQKEALEKQKLWELYKMETELIPLLLQMRKNGVRLDLPLLMKTVNEVTEKHFALQSKLHNWIGNEINLNSSAQWAKIFDSRGISYPRKTPTPLMIEKGKQGNPNLDKAALKKIAVNHPVCNDILEYRHYDTLINMFLHPYLDLQVDGRLYGSFHPLRSNEYGTVAGRFSASKPNLQQVSAMQEEGEEEDELSALKGQIIRSLFIPEEGHKWAKADYSQIEYRIMAHYAKGRGAEDLRIKYNQDPKTDMHQIIVDLTGFDRRTAKKLNFGGAYGMGIPTAASSFGWTIEDATNFMNGYHNAAPYVKNTRNAVSKVASRRGFIFTILGRKARTHPSRKLHSMFNRLIQGSAADVMKKAMVDCYKKGLFEELVPHLTVHDEMDVSYVDNKAGNEALNEMVVTMEQVVEFSVPLLVDCHTGNNWAEAD